MADSSGGMQRGSGAGVTGQREPRRGEAGLRMAVRERGVNGPPVIPARCPHRPPHSSRVEQVLSPPHSNRGGETTGAANCSRTPSSLRNHKKHTKRCQGPPSHPNTPSGQAQRHHQGLADSISGRKIIHKETDLSQKKKKKAEQAAGTSAI